MSHLVYKHLIEMLWTDYINNLPDFKKMFNQQSVVLDHFAIIVPGTKGIDKQVLEKVFNTIGLCKEGEGNIAEKQNGFIWLSHAYNNQLNDIDKLPKLVLADFDIDNMPEDIVEVVEEVIQPSVNIDLDLLSKLIVSAENGNNADAMQAALMVYSYLGQEHWRKPDVNGYDLVCSYNELLAWVLVSGVVVNHFGLAVHLMDDYESLNIMNSYIKSQGAMSIDSLNGEIKGNVKLGIEQSSVIGGVKKSFLKGGSVNIRGHFLEFVWRHKMSDGKYYDGFVSDNANYIVESLLKKTA